MKSLNRLFIPLFLLLAVCTNAAPDRGAWCWAGSATDDWGTTRFVGDSDREDAAIREFKRWGITRMYGSYRNRAIDEPETIAAFNAKLHAAGIAPIMLLSENTWIFPEHRTTLLETHVQKKLIDFNAACTNETRRFTALHFDIEPQGLPEWSSLSPADKKNRLNLLMDTFRDARAYMNTNGAANIPLYADLPVWFDNYPGGSVGWDSETERNQWFSELGDHLTGVSLMPFSRKSYSSISNGVAWEVANIPAEVRVGLEADIGPGATWPDFAAFLSMAQTIEADFNGIDIQSFKQFEAHTPPVPATLGKPSLSANGITLPISGYTPGSSNWIERCHNLQSNQWVALPGFVAWSAETNWSEPFGNNQAYYRITSK